jgi:ubiquitin C
MSVALTLSSNVASKSLFNSHELICDEFPIQIRSLTGKETPLKVHDKMIVSELKTLIEKIDQTPFDQQRLVYNGKQLEDARTLDYYAIQKDTIVHIILRIRGGMFHETSARKDYEVAHWIKSNECATNSCLALTIQELEEKLKKLKTHS